MSSRAFATRSTEKELLDGDSFDFAELSECFEQLRLINVLTSGYRPTLSALERIIGPHAPERPVEILDIGSGHGDLLREIARWAARRGLRVKLTGMDIEPRTIEIARRATPPGSPIRFEAGDALSLPLGREFDIIVNSLLAHHLSDPDIVRLLRMMTERGRLGWCVNDLHRHAVPYHFIRFATSLARCNRLIRNDAPVSVARSFTAPEWRRYLREADIDPALVAIRWHWPFRYSVTFRHGGQA